MYNLKITDEKRHKIKRNKNKQTNLVMTVAKATPWNKKKHRQQRQKYRHATPARR